MQACLLARRGFTAPLAALDGKFGLLEVFGGASTRPQALDEDAGERFAVAAWTKVYPFCGGLHAMAQALETLRTRHAIGPQSVKHVRVGVKASSLKTHAEVAPKETMAAQYSMPFAAALALVGDPRDPRAFIGEALNDPAVCALARRVELHHDPRMEGKEYPSIVGGAHVELELDDGRKFESEMWNAHGMPTKPCSEEQIRKKFRSVAGECISDASAADVAALVGRIETLPSVAPLSDALRGGLRA